MTLPDTMQALVQLHDGYSGTQEGPSIDTLELYLEAREVPVPQPQADQVVIKVDLAAVNPSDLHFIKGEYGQPRIKDAPAGFEGVGTVVAGDSPLVGQRVSFFATQSGTWAEYAMTKSQGLIPCRPDLRAEDAAGQIVNPLTAMAMFDIVRESGAKSFVLNAAGSQLGKLLIGLGRDNGIAPIAVVRRAEQADLLRELGASEVLVTSDDDMMAKAEPVLKSLKPRILLDAVGDQTTADLFFAMPNRARWVNYGKLSTTPPKLTQMGQLIFQHKVIEGFWLTRWMQETDPAKLGSVIEEVQERFVSGKWKTDVAAIVPLSEAMEKLPAATKIPDGKVFIKP
ncbi:alcohol dehydrogenase catalytic domain-containing protein [Pontivivens nitratireducens]|uniref:Zinc-binding dehydrogenase n=1 Tax=Pontivivens nitratireducens TaxID=2758038 RepID=A0A6G7VJC5_9RHOB|nr:zinc-binding dehydrogenase [Pontibrevibacter nitratireducens]QIK40104.1 zinc-binding dehydrogenase [Pontibrevibacter nitratireducens]